MWCEDMGQSIPVTSIMEPVVFYRHACINKPCHWTPVHPEQSPLYSFETVCLFYLTSRFYLLQFRNQCTRVHCTHKFWFVFALFEFPRLVLFPFILDNHTFPLIGNHCCTALLFLKKKNYRMFLIRKHI